MINCDNYCTENNLYDIIGKCKYNVLIDSYNEWLTTRVYQNYTIYEFFIQCHWVFDDTYNKILKRNLRLNKIKKLHNE
jgi:hypothetical protein